MARTSKDSEINVINTDECEFCRWGSLDESNKAKIIVHCDFDGKDRLYGRSIQCSHIEKRVQEDGTTEE